VNWSSVPQRLWEFVGESRQFSLSRICPVNDLQMTDLPMDALTLSALPRIEPPPAELNDSLGQTIQMEWNQIRPESPNFAAEDDLT
jgi:hypothetical protein